MAAPTGQEPVIYIPAAEVVGNAFARQYYEILELSPELVYRFYQDTSKLGRPVENGAMGSTTTMEAINEKIQSYGSLKAEVNFVDAQESYNGGVIVLVTGCMTNVDGSRHGFTQTFFLAPQDQGGYYVLNDIFRYVEDNLHLSMKQESIADAGEDEPCQEISPVKENHVSEQSNGEVYNPPENDEIPVHEEEKEEEEEEPLAEVVDEAPKESQVVVESNVKVEAPKTSYASIVMKATLPTTPASLPKSVPRIQEQQLPVLQARSLVPVPHSSGTENADDENNQEHEGDSHSVYLKNLPIEVSFEVVEENFKRFGPIKRGGIQIRNNKGFCFGFVEFEVADAVRTAVEASPIVIGGHEVVVEEKKSTSSRGSGTNNRGRYPPGRGGGYRGDGGRGRGSYGGGRGYGRGDMNKNDFGNRGSGRGYQNRTNEGYQNRTNEGYQRSDQTQTGNGGGGGGAGRMSRGVGPTIGSARPQRVTA